jgi:hypothetical protein
MTVRVEAGCAPRPGDRLFDGGDGGCAAVNHVWTVALGRLIVVPADSELRIVTVEQSSHGAMTNRKQVAVCRRASAVGRPLCMPKCGLSPRSRKRYRISVRRGALRHAGEQSFGDRVLTAQRIRGDRRPILRASDR